MFLLPQNITLFGFGPLFLDSVRIQPFKKKIGLVPAVRELPLSA